MSGRNYRIHVPIVGLATFNKIGFESPREAIEDMRRHQGDDPDEVDQTVDREGNDLEVEVETSDGWKPVSRESWEG